MSETDTHIGKRLGKEGDPRSEPFLDKTGELRYNRCIPAEYIIRVRKKYIRFVRIKCGTALNAAGCSKQMTVKDGIKYHVRFQT